MSDNRVISDTSMHTENMPSDQSVTDTGGSNSVSSNKASVKNKPLNDSQNQESLLVEIMRKLEVLSQKVDRIERNQGSVDNAITGNDGVLSKLSDLQEVTGDITGQIASHDKDLEELKSEVGLMKQLALKQNQVIENLKHECEDLCNRSMRNNVLFHNIPEGGNGEPEAKVLEMLRKTKMSECDTISFERVHRLGQVQPKAKSPRPIVAKLLSCKDVQKLITHGKSLPKGVGLPYITPQYSLGLREKRKSLVQYADGLKKSSPPDSLHTKLVYDKLWINGQLQKDPLPRPTPADVLNLPSIEREDLEKSSPQLIQGDSISRSGHVFQATIAEVKSMSEVRMAYKKLIAIPLCMGAAHNIAAYSLYNAKTADSTQGWQDDGDHGAGRFLAQILQRHNAKNVVIFLTRRFQSSSHMGPSRFTAMEEACASAIMKLT